MQDSVRCDVHVAAQLSPGHCSQPSANKGKLIFTVLVEVSMLHGPHVEFDTPCSCCNTHISLTKTKKGRAKFCGATPYVMCNDTTLQATANIKSCFFRVLS